MKVCEAQTILGELVNVRSTDLAAEAANIGEAEVVGDDDEKIWAFGW